MMTGLKLTGFRLLKGCLLSLLLWQLAACSKYPDKPLSVGSNRWPGYETLYLARDSGWLDPKHIRLVELPNATDVVSAIRNGFLDGGGLTLDEVLSLQQDGIEMRVVLAMDFSAGGDALLAQPTITRLNQLRGKRIGVESSAVGAVMLDAALDQGGLLVTDVVVVPMTVEEHEDAFRLKQVDAVVTFEPVLTRLRRDGAKVLTDSRTIPGRIVDVMAFRKDSLDHRLQAVRHLVEGHFQAIQLLKDQPQEAAAKIAPRLKMSVEEVLDSYRGLVLPNRQENRNMLSGSTSALRLRAENLARLMLDKGLLQRMPDVASMVDDRAVKEN